MKLRVVKHNEALLGRKSRAIRGRLLRPIGLLGPASELLESRLAGRQTLQAALTGPLIVTLSTSAGASVMVMVIVIVPLQVVVVGQPDDV